MVITTTIFGYYIFLVPTNSAIDNYKYKMAIVWLLGLTATLHSWFNDASADEKPPPAPVSTKSRRPGKNRPVEKSSSGAATVAQQSMEIRPIKKSSKAAKAAAQRSRETNRLSDWQIEMLRDTVATSNRLSLEGVQRYVLWENQAIGRDYEFIPCPCNEKCWCRQHGCEGHYRIMDIGFKQFLETYTTLWIPPNARDRVISAVLMDGPFEGRQRNAIEPLKWLHENCYQVIKRVREYERTGLCGEPPEIVPQVDNLYKAKIGSQLFYDSIVPFDTSSRPRMKRAGYPDPTRHFPATNIELFADLRIFAERFSLSMSEIRDLDSPWQIVPNFSRQPGGQPLSRVLDKAFYTPRK